MDDLVLESRRWEGRERRTVSVVHDALDADDRDPREARAGLSHPESTVATVDNELISLINVVSLMSALRSLISESIATGFEALGIAEHHPQVPAKVTWQQVNHEDSQCLLSAEYPEASQPQRWTLYHEKQLGRVQ